jgi:hypothetical protein
MIILKTNSSSCCFPVVHNMVFLSVQLLFRFLLMTFTAALWNILQIGQICNESF